MRREVAGAVFYDPFDEDVGTLVVEMRARGLACDAGVESGGGDGFDDFLAGLVDDWKGWRGTRRWESLRGDLAVEATRRGGSVELLFVLRARDRARDEREPDSWEVRLPIVIDPGESLSRLALATAALFDRS